MIRILLFIGIIFQFTDFISLTNAMIINKDQVQHLSPDFRYASSMNIDEVMNHLNVLQNIATEENGNRAIISTGYNRTLDYITNYLSSNTNFKVTKTFFFIPIVTFLHNPTLSSKINGLIKIYTHSFNLNIADFHHVMYSGSININTDVPLTVIPNLGCFDADWLAARPPPTGFVAIVKRGDCTFENKAILAAKYNVAALLLYNDGITTDRIQPIYISLSQNNLVPALFLSYIVGQSLVNAANDPSRIVTVRLSISVETTSNPVGNICADTPTGDVTQTILIGSHSDSVHAGPGINDNGSGSAANLALAATLSRLVQTSNYAAYKYRIRFCWWGAQELGLLGSDFHVKEAIKSTIIGERITDYLVNIDLDMLGSPNFIFGIYDDKLFATIPASAKPGSSKITTLFTDWFTRNKLPLDHIEFVGRSDYAPFLAAGIVAGGLCSGRDEVKTVEQRSRYEAALGSGLGGTSGVSMDVCYHMPCDTITNINKFALDKMVQAAAYIIESMAQQSDLKVWLYPTEEIEQMSKQSQQRQYEYNSINEYFGLPYN